MRIKTEAIVVKYFRYSENSIIAHLYTREYGRQTFLFKGGKTKKTQQKINFLQPLYQLEVPIDFRENRTMYNGNGATMLYNYQSIPFAHIKRAISFFLAELLSQTLHTQEKDDKLFLFLNNSFSFFDKEEVKGSNFHLAFMVKLSLYLGISPIANYTEQSPFLSIEQGCYTSELLPNSLDKEMSYIIFQMQKSNWEECEQIALSRNMRTALLFKLLQYYNYHLHDFGEIKSLAVLQELFS